MTGFDPGPGWRQVRYGHELEGHENLSWDSTGLAGGESRGWVREPSGDAPRQQQPITSRAPRSHLAAAARSLNAMRDVGEWVPMSEVHRRDVALELQYASTLALVMLAEQGEPDVRVAETPVDDPNDERYVAGYDAGRREGVRAALDRVTDESWVTDSDLQIWRRDLGVQS